MKKIFTGAQIAELDRYTMRSESIEHIDLVERAARAFVYEFNRHYMPRRNDVFVFAGRGNNGADALAIARLLLEDSYSVQVILFNTSGSLSPSCEANRQRLLDTPGSHLQEVRDEFTPPVMRHDSVVIDGLFGTGLNRELEGGYAMLIEFINRSEREVVSVDIPSGLYSEENDLGRRLPPIIKATRTFSFEQPKLSFFMAENSRYLGQWQILSIGLSERGKEEIESDYFQTTDFDMARSILARDRFAHKGDFGHALLVSGSRGHMGAACLAAKGALRSGAGLLTVHVPACGEVIMQTALPEAMTESDMESDLISGVPQPDKFDAVGAGPGIGVGAIQEKMLRQLILSMKKPMVLDADALNIIAEHRDLLDLLPSGSILTPHARELERLTTYCDNDYQRLCQARALSANHQVYVVLKGAYTATCMPSGKVVFNSSGNAGMATAGSGDVLTGIITGLLAQGYAPATAAVLGVYLHGLAGDLYAGRYSQQSLLAGDIAEYLGEAYKQLLVH